MCQHVSGVTLPVDACSITLVLSKALQLHTKFLFGCLSLDGEVGPRPLVA